MVRDHAFDLVQFDLPENISLVHALGPTGAKKVFVHHEIKSERVRSHTRARGVHYAYSRDLHGSLQAVEAGHLNAYDAVVVLTDADRQRLVNWLKVYPSRFTPRPLPSRMPSTSRSIALSDGFAVDKVLFSRAVCSIFPTMIAVEWLLENRLPQSLPPSLKLTLVYCRVSGT